jgi:hypothetical protein
MSNRNDLIFFVKSWGCDGYFTIWRVLFYRATRLVVPRSSIFCEPKDLSALWKIGDNGKARSKSGLRGRKNGGMTGRVKLGQTRAPNKNGATRAPFLCRTHGADSKIS